MARITYLLVYFSYAHLCTCVSLLWVVCAGKSRKGKLVHWVERASFKKIRRFLEIFEQEQHYEVLLTVKNLHDLSRHSTPYSVSIILHPLASEIVEGEHFVTADLLNLIPDSLSLARESETEAESLELAVCIQPGQPSASEDSCLPLGHPGRLRGVVVWSVLPWQERAPTLPPSHGRKRRGC